MLLSLVTLALAAAGFVQAQAPEGYRTVYMTSMANKKFTIEPTTRTAGSTIVIRTLAKKLEQQWYLKANATKIQLANSTLCLDAGSKSPWADFTALNLQACSDTAEGQKWNVMADGRIALVPSQPQKCVDLYLLGTKENNPVVLFGCAGLGNSGARDTGINWPLVDATL